MMRATIQRVVSLGLAAVVAALLSACGGGSDNPAPAPASTSTSFNVGGTVSGLAGSGLQLRLNGGAALAVTANGVFSFPAQLAAGTSYAVTVVQQPTAPTQLCSVANGSGTLAGTVINIQVTCVTQVTVGGTVSGLTGSGLQLSLNGGAPLAISADGGFSFLQAVAQGTAYTVAVAQQPSAPAQICMVNNASGVAAASDITTVQIQCLPASAIGGVVQGLAGTGLQLSLNGGAPLAVAASGAFAFSTQLAAGASYSVTVAQQPSGGVAQTCTVVNGTGTVTGPVTNVQINCPPPAPTGLAVTAGQKQLQFNWVSAGATVSHQLQRQVAGGAWADDGPAMPVATVNTARDVAVHRTDWATTRYRLTACNDGGCTASTDIGIASAMLNAIVYAKASNTGAEDGFGYSVSLSADGNWLAVGANSEASSAFGVDGNQADNTAFGSGAVYVFMRVAGNTWMQQAYLKASNSELGDVFGVALSLNADGSTLVVGAYLEDSDSTGINGVQLDNDATSSGAVYVFTRAGSTWSQQAYIKASNTGAGDSFGYAVSLSADGSTLAVGAFVEDSQATGINGIQADENARNSGAVYIFVRAGNIWTQQAYLKASNTGWSDQFGYAVSLSADGSTLAVGAFLEDSKSTGINAIQADQDAPNSGAVYVFVRAGSTWSQQAYIKASNTGSSDHFGHSVSLSADGNTLAVGAINEDSSATGINGAQDDPLGINLNSGAVYVFVRAGSTWSQQAYIKASNTGADDRFGWSVSLSADGTTLAVGADYEDSGATGVAGIQANESTTNSGAVYVFVRFGSAWSQQAYIKASNTGVSGYFGSAVSLSADSRTLAVGALGERSGAIGINGNQADDSAPRSGAVYLY
jgi:hypothetical protein